MPTMKIFIGPPASGKSTERKQFIAKNPEWRYINYDELRADNPHLPEREVLALADGFANVYFSLGYNFIVDNTNLNPKTVQKWENKAKAHGYAIDKQLFTHVPFWELVKRDNNRENKVGRSVIYRMCVDAGYFVDYAERDDLYDIDESLTVFGRNAVIVDIDGTLANIEHRRHFVQVEEGQKKDWGSFFAHISEDILCEHVAETIQLYSHAGYTIILCSGRGEEHRKVTEKWLTKHNINYFVLLMRGFNDKREDSIVKEELYKKYIEPFFDVRLVLDDRDRVVEMWRKKGLVVYQVADGKF